MPVLHSPESAFAKESVKWEAQHSSMGPGLRPYVRRDYPMMLHKAGRVGQGGSGEPVIVETEIIESESKYDYYRGIGFRETPLEALQAVEDQEREYATLAAERQYEVKNKLSGKAIAEVTEAEAVALGHLPSIPVRPIAPKRT